MSTFGLDLDSVTPTHWIGIAFAIMTGIIHLWLAAEFLPDPMGWGFLIAAIGFALGSYLVLANYRRSTLYLVGIPFTAGQIVLWWVVNDITVSDLTEPGIGVFDKVVQVALILILIRLYMTERPE